MKQNLTCPRGWVATFRQQKSKNNASEPRNNLDYSILFLKFGRKSFVKGEISGRALRMILEWLEDHRSELMNNWEKAQKGEPLDKIEPLK